MPSSNIRSSTWVYYISHQVYCRGHAVLQEPHLGALYLPSSVLHILSCKSGASLGILYLPHSCTAYDILYIRSLTWVYCIWHLVYCICHHVHREPHLGVLHLPSSVLQRPCCTSGAPLGCTAFVKCTLETIIYSTSGTPLGCTAYPIMYIRSLAWVYCICQQVHWIYHQVFPIYPIM